MLHLTRLTRAAARLVGACPVRRLGLHETMAVMQPDDLADLRRNYGTSKLAERDLAADPMTQFRRWFDEAAAARLVEPNAMVLSTADIEGQPSSRTVLLKGFDKHGFTFFSNYGSRKAQEIAVNPQASLLFPWFPMERQVVVVGDVERIAREESARYFGERPRGSQVGAWTSRQSEVVASRDELERRYRELDDRFGDDVPVPDFWGGYLVRPRLVEFWQGRSDRLHDRLRFRRNAVSAGTASWVVERLSP